MDKNNFDIEINKLRSNYKFYKSSFIWLIAANILLGFIILTNINKERIIIVPQTAPEYKMWLSQSQASAEYLNTLSRNVMDLLLNITPDNVGAQHAELLRLVSTSNKHVLEGKFSEIAHQLQLNNLSQNFYINSIKVINKNNIVYVHGTLNQYIDKNVANQSEQVYKLTFKINNYSVQLNNIELVDPSAAELREI